ncbi:hypothetical protein ES705_26530 [subsurface metagenome]
MDGKKLLDEMKLKNKPREFSCNIYSFASEKIIFYTTNLNVGNF